MIKTLLNHDWMFSPDGSKPAPVRIPHDWLIGDAHNHYKTGIGRYFRKLTVDFHKNNPEQTKTSLRFEGVYMDSTLRVNGEFAGEWKYGYTTFEHDITRFLKDGENEIELTVNYDGQSSRWYTGAGIYRDVWLITRNVNHFAPDGIYITTAYTNSDWTWEAEAEVITDGRSYEVKHTLLDSSGIDMNGTKIEPWDLDSPHLYTVRSDLYVDGGITDTVYNRIGFRTIEFTTDRGFFLNGKRLKIYGVCQHHDLGSLGAAWNKDAARRQLGILRKMGVNAIRTAHNPPAPGLLDLCDEMGFIVMDELTDIWRKAKTPGDYARFFDEWIERDVASWIRRDRNHPCVVMWSIGNEIPDTHASYEEGSATLRMLMGLVKQHDPKENASVTFSSNYMPWENTQKCADYIKLVGYNYAPQFYKEHHERHPDWIIYGGETASTLQSRGIYHFPLSRQVLADDDLQCSSLGNTTTSWGAKNPETCIREDFEADFSLGQFLWSGTDYLGEPTPYHTKNCYFGQTDTACFEKDSYYVYKAAWTDHKTDPFVYIFPYWDFSPGQLIDVRVCSNAPKVELFLNDKKILEEDLGDNKSADGKWITGIQIPYEPGTLRAEAVDGSGKVIAAAYRHSFGDAARLETQTVTYGELDFVTITAIDANSKAVDNANCRVNVSVKNGELLTLDNGDATDYEPYHASSRRMFSGKLLAIVKRINDTDPVVTAAIDEQDIPIRKIELRADGYDISAKILPGNATYKDLSWRLTDYGGNDSPMGELKVSGDKMKAVIIPKGDGEGYVRCMANNGRGHPVIICVLETKVTGMGKPFFDPYKFISAGLYNACNAEPGSGNERGIATRRLEETHVGFTDVDFGNFGSDEITLWLFPLSPEPFDFDIFEGMPGDGGELIYTAHYDKGSVWNTYIEASYKLPRRLSGVTTLCLVFQDKVHIKGFKFTKQDKAFAKLYANDNDSIYGDSFKAAGRTVEGIGNNVSIIYDDMDFGSAGANEIEVSWRSEIQNPVRIDFDTQSGSVRQMIAIPAQPGYDGRIFTLDTPMQGKGKLSLVFLPGCELDLEYIQFRRNSK